MPGGIPICVLDPEVRLFRVLHSKGKILGSFGVSNAQQECGEKASASSEMSSDDVDTESLDTGDENNKEDTLPKGSQEENRQISSSQYLFVEEALFLHERGLIEVYNDKDQKLDSCGLYNLLPVLDVPFSIYRAYAHLRAQTYIVVRHTPRRLELLRQVTAYHERSTANAIASDTSVSWKKRRKTPNSTSVRRELREDAFYAPPPRVVVSVVSGLGANDIMIAFDVYEPNASFRKTNPGPPDFYVMVTHYNLPSPTMTELLAVTKACDGIPLRIATVADSGTVVMFGVSDGVPFLTPKEAGRSQPQTGTVANT